MSGKTGDSVLDAAVNLARQSKDRADNEGFLARQLLRLVDGLATPSPAAVAVPRDDEGLAEFTEYFVKNYPGPTTIIHDPRWHAPKIFRAAQRAMLAAAPQVEAGGWVKCSERLPSMGDKILVVRRNRIESDDYARPDWFAEHGVTHWQPQMPIPPVPEPHAKEK